MVIILAGELRGDQNKWDTLEKFRHKYNASVFIGSYDVENYKTFPIPHQITKTYCIHDTFHNCTHPHVEKYKHQYSNLFLTWEYFKDNIDENEIIVKLRNDFILYDDLDLDFNTLNDNTIYVPEKEHHEPKPFNTDIVCNDQIVLGTKQSMDIYFQFPKNFICYDPNSNGVEALLRDYLRQQNLNLKTFKWTYTK